VQRLLRIAIASARGATRAALQIELAGIRSRFFSDAEGAVALCREALDLCPNDPRALLALAEHCQAASQWAEAARALAALAEGEDSPLRSGKYFQLAGAAAENAVTAMAIGYYERALECYFTPGRMPPESMRAGCMRAFDDIERLLIERRDWKGLERAYRTMIKRMAPGAAELPRLWEGLGKIYKDHLGHRASAIQSFEVASELDKDRLTHHRVLIDLYSGVETDELDKLVERRLKLVAAEPFNPDHYAALRSLWAKMKLWDRTFAACRALVFLGRADRKEDEFFRRYRSDSVVWPRRQMNENDWRRLRHPDEDQLLSAVMALVAEPIALSHAVTARRLRLEDDTWGAHDHLRHLYRNVCAALAIGTPRAYVAPPLDVDIVLANLKVGSALAPSFAIGRHMYQGRSSVQMVHSMARALSYARPAAYLRLLLGGNGELGTALAAARAAAVRPGSTEGVSLDERVSRLHGCMARWARQPVWVAELRGALRRLRERGGAGPVDLDRWGRAVDASARRAGLLLAGGLEVAASDLDREPLFAQRTSREKRVSDLLLHSVSEEHFALRKDLGLALDD
jgi:tetratricopeptide (TPR) repeat protein